MYEHTDYLRNGESKFWPYSTVDKALPLLRIPQFPLRIYETLQTTASGHLRLGEAG